MKFRSPRTIESLLSSTAFAPPVRTRSPAWIARRNNHLFPSTSLMLDSPVARRFFDFEDFPFGDFEERRRANQAEIRPSLVQQMDKHLNIVRQMHQQMDRMIAPLRDTSTALEELQPMDSSPRFEIVNDDSTFRLKVDVPNLNADNLDVSLENKMLTVSGHRESTSEDGKSRFKSRFSQSLSLDSSVDVEKLSAEVKDGVLTVTAPKDPTRVEAGVRKIPIAGSGQLAASGSSVASEHTMKAGNTSADADGASIVDAAEKGTSNDNEAGTEKTADAASGEKVTSVDDENKA